MVWKVLDTGWYYLGEDQEMDKQKAIALLAQPHIAVACDTETVSLQDRTPIGFGIATDPDNAFYWRLWPEEAPYFPWRIFHDPTIMKVFHNAMFDLPAMYEKYKINVLNVLDTMVMCSMHGLPPKLQTLAAGLGIEISDISEIQTRKSQPMTEIDPEVLGEKCCWDIRATYALFLKILPDTPIHLYTEEMQVIPILTVMQSKGLLIDHEEVDKFYVSLSKDVDFYREQAEDLYSFNPGSPQQVAYVLAMRAEQFPDTHTHLNVKRAKYGITPTKATLDTGKEFLEKMSDPVAALTLNYRGVSRLLSTYVRPLRDRERAYTHFHLETATNRLGSRDLNMQNVPKPMRVMFIPDSGTFTSFDYSQQELRVLAYVSGDRAMKAVFEDEHGDIHTNTAKYMGVPRDPAKNTTYAMVYGGSEETIADTAGISDPRQAAELRKLWGRTYPQAMDWIMYQSEVQAGKGWVEDIYGRRIYLPDPEFDLKGWPGVQRKAVNYPIQGSAAAMTKKAMILCVALDMRLQIHDEIVIDGYVERLPSGITSVAPFPTPVSVKYTNTWV